MFPGVPFWDLLPWGFKHADQGPWWSLSNEQGTDWVVSTTHLKQPTEGLYRFSSNIFCLNRDNGSEESSMDECWSPECPFFVPSSRRKGSGRSRWPGPCVLLLCRCHILPHSETLAKVGAPYPSATCSVSESAQCYSLKKDVGQCDFLLHCGSYLRPHLCQFGRLQPTSALNEFMKRSTIA